jgi:membrane-bound lytic murein transglycosylase D
MLPRRFFGWFAGLIAATGSFAAAAQDGAVSVPAPTPVSAETSSPVAADSGMIEAAVPVAKAAAPKADPLFPRYKILEPNVAFWAKVFSEYSEDQSVVHSIDDLTKVFEVLDFRAEAARMSKEDLARFKSTEENRVKKRVDGLLAEAHANRNNPEALSGDALRMYRMYPESEGENRFKNAIGSFRAQRGLRERTRLALETSGKYLPQMEQIFRGYELPMRLTRLPLVESSFNVEAYSKVGAAGLWQFMPASARIYMRMDEVVDDRRDPWTSTDAAARHLRDDYTMLQSWPLAITAYNHGRGGVARGLQQVGGTELPDLIRGYQQKSFGFASRNFYAEFLAASDVEREWRTHFGEIQRKPALAFEVVETQHYVPYETLRKLCDADDELFRKLNPAYRPEVIEGKLYVPPGHLIRVPAGRAQSFSVAYSRLGSDERFDRQKVYYLLHKIKKGDTLGRLAKTYGTTQSAIRAANGMGSKKSGLRAGRIVKIPPREERRPGPVTVAVGESKPGLTAEETRAVVAERKAEQRKAAKPRFRTHKVRSGQTLSSIARTYKVSVGELRRANKLGESSHIRAGQRLRIPTG